MKIGKAIKLARESKNMSKVQLSNALGVSRNIVWFWESDKSVPRGEILLKMQKIIGLKLDEIELEESECKKLEESECKK